MQLVIRGVLTLTSLTHQTSPAGKGQQIKTNVLTPEGMLFDVPFLTANSVRALIRRASAEEVFQRLQAAGSRISRNLYLSLVRGSFARTGLKSGGATYTEMIEAAAHPFAGLFGGGVFMYRSPWRIERDLIPVLTSYAKNFPSDVQPMAVDLKPFQLLTQVVMAPRDDFAKLPPSARQNVDNLGQAYAEHMAKKVQQAADKKSGDAESKDDLDNFAMTECIVPGVPLCFGMTTADVTPAQAGLLLLGLKRWANNNALGGGSARGRGSFVPTLSLTIDGKRVVDNLLVGDAPYLVLSDNEQIATLLAECDAAMGPAATPEALARVFPSDFPDDEKKSPKAKKTSNPKPIGDAGAALPA